MEPATILLYIFFAALGALVGAFIQHALDRRPAPPPAIVPVPEPLPAEDQPLADDEVEVMRLGRTPSGSAWLEMDGGRLLGKESLQPEQRRRLVNMLVDLRPWLETAPQPAAVPPAQPRPVITAVPPLKSGKPADKEAAPPVVLKSIVEQINDVLQASLQSGPLKDRGLQLAEGPGGMVLVRDGLKKYEGIEAVPEPEIRALIRQAVSDWEKLPTVPGTPS